jgi:hypothetical protein
MSSDNKNPVRVAAGLKATLHRDNVSDEAKQHAEERLQEMGALSADEPSSIPTSEPLNSHELGPSRFFSLPSQSSNPSFRRIQSHLV